MKQLAFGTKLWLGLVSIIFVADVYALATDKETFSAAYDRAMKHPGHRKLVIVSWLLTTKHLMFGNYFKWADPFGIMVL